MSAHDKLEHQLRASIARTAPQRPTPGPRRQSWSRHLSALIVALSSATVLAVAVIALVLLHHGSSPSPTPTPPATTRHGSRFGPPPRDPGPIPANVDDAVVAAWNTAWRKDPACRPASGQGPGSGVTDATPSSEMLSALPELRRPATSVDHLPTSLYKRFGGRLRLLVGGDGGDVYIRYLRRVRVTAGPTFYLVPVANLGRPPLSASAANRCYRLEAAALQAALRSVPAAKRAPTRRYGDAEFALGRYNLETSSVHEGASLFAENINGGGGGGGAQSLESIQQGGPLGGGGGNPPTSIVMDGIVPSSVARVTLHFPAIQHEGRRLPTLNATGEVANNVFIIPIPTLFQRGGWPSAAIWRSANGTIIKTVNERPFHP
jgi:hypothetical protein